MGRHYSGDGAAGVIDGNPPPAYVVETTEFRTED
jgi:hypothetical protein